MGSGVTSDPSKVAGIIAIDFKQRQSDLRARA
jgi:hypothetical protein